MSDDTRRPRGPVPQVAFLPPDPSLFRTTSDRAPSDRAGSDRAGSDRAGSDRAGSDRAGSDRAGSDRAGSDRAGSDRANGERRSSANGRLPLDGDDAPATEDGATSGEGGRRRRRGGRRRRRSGDDPAGAESGQAPEAEAPEAAGAGEPEDEDQGSEDNGEETGRSRRRRRRRRSDGGTEVVADDVAGVRGSTRLEAKRQRRREGRDANRRRGPVLTEAEFLARRESVDRAMLVRSAHGRVEIAVIEDGVLVEHYVAGGQAASMIGNVHLGRVQNVLPSMEAAFVDIGRGRNAVLYAGEVNWRAAGLADQPKRIELALRPGDPVLVQVTKDPVGHKGARLTSQIALPGRYLVYVPNGSMTGISRKLPDQERNRLKRLLREILPEDAGVIVRTAAEGATAEQLAHDVERLCAQWQGISDRAVTATPPAVLYSEPDLAIKVVRDIFNEDVSRMLVSGAATLDLVSSYVAAVAPDLADRVQPWTGVRDIFAEHRIDEQIAKALDRRVYLPSGGSLVIDRTEAMTVVDVNTGKFTGQGGTLEETVTRNNLEAAEEIVRQLRLRDIGGIIVIDFIDMVLESNRDLVLRRLVECLGRDRTKHQVAEVTSLGLVQMTRKRIGQGLLETFSEPCAVCAGRGVRIALDVPTVVPTPASLPRPMPTPATAGGAAAPDAEPLTGRGQGSLSGSPVGGERPEQGAVKLPVDEEADELEFAEDDIVDDDDHGDEVDVDDDGDDEDDDDLDDDDDEDDEDDEDDLDEDDDLDDGDDEDDDDDEDDEDDEDEDDEDDLDEDDEDEDDEDEDDEDEDDEDEVVGALGDGQDGIGDAAGRRGWLRVGRRLR